MKVVIVGGVAGGATAAARLRRLDENAQIIIIERSGYISYANCGLPYYIGEEIKEKSALTLQTPQSFYNRFRIDARVKQEVIKINRDEKTVVIRRIDDGEEYTESYDKLILSPGAKPVIPPLPGIDNEKIMTVRTVEDTFKVYDYIENNSPKKAVVAGGGFIGLETAENLLKRGIDVTLIERSTHVMPPFDEDMAAIMHNCIKDNGIDLRVNTSVTGFNENGGKIEVSIDNGESINADMVIMSVGVTPESTLAKRAGLETGIRGAIAVNTNMLTSDENIYAVGDAVEVNHYVSGKKTLIALAGPANKQGRIAADNICGIKSEYKGSQGSSVLKLFNMTAAATGMNNKATADSGYDYDNVILTSASHATYYPGATNMTVKVTFEKKTGKILGAQIVGYDGVDKRIDVLATAIRANMTAFDLTDLDLAYAPPYSSAKDPVNMAGYAIENILTGKVNQVHWSQVLNNSDDDVILDTRTDMEYAMGNIPTAIHIPVDSLRERMGEIPKDKKIYVYCQSGLRSYIACRILKQNGYTCYNVSGGYGFYSNVVKGSCLEAEGTGPCGLKKC